MDGVEITRLLSKTILMFRRYRRVHIEHRIEKRKEDKNRTINKKQRERKQNKNFPIFIIRQF